MKRTAFMTVEVLISLVIISMGVLTITSALKTLYAATDKQKHYEQAAIVLFSLKDTLRSIDFEKQKHIKGRLNGWNYTINAEQIVSRHNYTIDPDSELLSGNNGPHTILLYKITLAVNDDILSKQYTLYESRYKTKNTKIEDAI